MNLAWPQIDWERNLITVISTKNNQDRTIPMNETVKELLISRWRQSDKTRRAAFQ
jgi:integrase